MTQHDELIKVLNEAISIEYTAAFHYNQHSTLLIGRDRQLFENLFEGSAKEALSHARKWSNRIVHLGGVPNIQVQPVQQTIDTTEMLEMALELEKRALDSYTRAHALCKHEPTLYMLEDQIADEDKDVERLQKLLGRVQIAQTLSQGRRPAA